ncbi:TM2 domain-containing protein [Desulfitobacterium sp. PCE1]|uniref:TM2 domain-containing protein n=1 Tax=Desulfitobacterium sp. PCE1 TaxID=146907 RepID=UPI00036A1BBF|nr:TM2 domain-containing protein [Desulfitobacterium sp. PCE1]
MSIQEKQNLTEKQLSILNSEMEKHKKSTGLAYVLWFFFGTLGIHKFYIGNTKWGIAYLALGIIGWVSMLTGGTAALAEGGQSGLGVGTFGLLCLILVGIFLLVDLFTIPKQLRKVYEVIEAKTIKGFTA